MNIIMLNV